MPTISDFIKTATTLPRATFLAANSHWMLIYDPQEVEAGEFSGDGSTTSARPRLREAADEVEVVRILRQVVAPIKKGDSLLHGPKIALGRSIQCEIQILHPAMSRVHAFFVEEADGVYVVDGGSRHGTFHKGNRLAAGKPQRLENGDDLMFGTIATQVFSPGGFLELVKYADDLSKR